MSTSTPPLRAAIYARLSTAQLGKGADEASDSIANQIRDLEKVATDLKYDMVGVFKDDGISGYRGKHRPGFQRLLTAIADHKVDVVLVRHQDRLERNREEATMIQVASIRNKVQWQFGDRQILDPSTAGGGLLADVLSAIARFESAVKRERLLMHYDGKRTSGTFQAPPGTFGYLRENVVEWEAQLIREAYEAIDSGRTMGSIVRQWNKAEVPQRKKGKHGWSYAHIRSILQRPRNAGMVADKDGSLIRVVNEETGEEMPLIGQWEAILQGTDEDPDAGIDLWQRVNHIINDPSRATSPGFTPRWLGAGHAKCGICGKPMKSNTVSDSRAGTRYSILKCSRAVKDGTRHPSARNEDLDALIRAAIIDAFAYGTASQFQEAGAPDVGATHMELAKINAKREEAKELWREEVFSKAEMTAELKRTEAPMKALQDRLNDAVANSASASMLVDLRAGLRTTDRRASLAGMAELKAELGRRFDSLDIEQRRRLVGQHLTIRVNGGRMTTNPDKYRIEHVTVTSLNSTAWG